MNFEYVSFFATKMATVILFLFSIFAASVTAMTSSKKMEGYPSGYMSDCPGSTDKAIITPKSRKDLFITVIGPGNVLSAQRNKYTYYQVKQLANDPYLDFERKTVLYIGGYLDSSSYPTHTLMSKAYYDAGYNTLSLDTLAFTSTEYPIASRFMRPVGFLVAEMLSNLTDYGLDPKKLELVGLSLGAHTMSFIAKNFRLLTGKNISRLTGLDPAGPCFRNLGPDQRLDQTDADFVDVVYTNIDGYGMAAPVGHVNYYINGGEYQPGEFQWYPCGSFCSHTRAYSLWVSAINYPNEFIAIKCKSVQQARNTDCYDNKPRITNLLGPNVDKTKHGIFFLATQGNYPYYMGKKGLMKRYEFFRSHIAALNRDSVRKI